MEWEITGANRHTGQDVRVIVEGDTAEEASAAAAALGVLVARTKPRPPSPDSSAQPARSSRRGQPVQTGVVTTQRTGKLWKAAQIVGGLFLLAGGPMMILSATTALEAGTGSQSTTGVFALGLLFVVVGLPTLLLARLGAWWFHG